jgi:GTPase SAR1 family protein
MGLCASSDLSPEEQQRRKAEKERSKALESTLTQEHSADQAVNKLLLLGAGESGKSTLFKQMIQIYGKGYPDHERKTFIPIIYNNIITTMKTLCAQSATYAPIQDPQLLGIKNYIENELKGDEDIEENLAANIQALWLSPEIQETYKNRAHYHLTDSAAYFNDRIIEVGADHYLPSEQDVLRSRVRTTGIVENEFEIDGNQFKMFDVRQQNITHNTSDCVVSVVWGGSSGSTSNDATVVLTVHFV